MAVTGVNNTTTYGSHYTESGKKTAGSEKTVDNQKVETAAQATGKGAAQKESVIGQTKETYKNGNGDVCEITRQNTNAQEEDVFRKGTGWKDIKNGQVGCIVVTTKGSKGKSLLQKMRERSEEIRLKNLRKRAKAEKRAAELATKRLERKRRAMRHSKVNYRV